MARAITRYIFRSRAGRAAGRPPRGAGIGEQLATRIEASGVERVLYSSCNPRTLAADLAHLPSMRVVRSRLFDMFPHTEHAEVLVELVRD